MSENTIHILLIVVPAAALVSLPGFLLVFVMWRGMGRALVIMEAHTNQAAHIGSIDTKVEELAKRLHEANRDITLGLNKVRGEIGRVEDMLSDHRVECSEKDDRHRRTG